MSQPDVIIGLIVCLVILWWRHGGEENKTHE